MVVSMRIGEQNRHIIIASASARLPPCIRVEFRIGGHNRTGTRRAASNNIGQHGEISESNVGM